MRREHLIQYLAAVVLVVCAVVWFSAMGKVRTAHALLADGNRELEQAKQTLKELQAFAAKERAANKPAITDAEVLELARLRSEVTRLRNEERTTTIAPAAPRATSAVTAPPAETPPVATEMVTFTNSVSATIPLGHTLALGGWVEPGTGKRILSFVTPETSPDAPGSVLVQTRLMSVPDALLDRFGLQGLRAELPPGQPPSFDAAQFPALLKAMEQTDGVDILSMPRVLTLSGRQAQVSLLNGREGGPPTGPSVDITPTLDAAGTNVRLDVGVGLKMSSPAKQP